MRTKRKFWLTMLLIAAMSLLFLGACSGGKDDEKGGSDKNGEETVSKITIFQSKVEISEQLEALAKEYEKETGVEVEVWGTTGDDYFQQYTN